MAFIKNIIPTAFGLHGNRGLGFPIKGHFNQSVADVFLTNVNCELQEDISNISITLEDGNTPILVACGDSVSEIRQPNTMCYLGTQEDASEQILQQEGNPILVSCD